MRRRWVLAVAALCLLGHFFESNAAGGSSGPITWGGSIVIGGGWGRMVELTNGTWLCVTAQYPAGTNSYLRIQRSTNFGRTWTDLSLIREGGRTLDNGELVCLPDGTVLLTMRSLIPEVSYRLPVYASTNQGLTWSYRSNIDTSEGLGGRGLWEPDFWVLEGGRLMVTYSNEKHEGYSQLISERVSNDGGKTWGPEVWVVAQAGGGNLRPGMSQVARMQNGKYIMVYEIVNLGLADVYCKISPDGTNWPSGLGNLVPCQHCGPFVCSLPNGLVLVSSCENQVSFSEDFGETWEKIDPPAWDLGYFFSWPAVYRIRSNEVGVMVVSNGTRLRFGDVSPRRAWPLVLTENFDDNNDDGWSRYGGKCSLDSGRYLLSNQATYGKALTGDAFWTDGTLKVDMRITSAGNAGLMIRCTNPDYTGPDACRGYFAGLDTGGWVLLGRMDNAWAPLTNRPLSVGINVWHQLQVKTVGSLIEVFVDDMSTPKLAWNDSTYKRGLAGVRAFQCDAQFDNFIYTNDAPIRLSVKLDSDGGLLSWSNAPSTLRMHTAMKLAAPVSGFPLQGTSTLSTGLWSFRFEGSTNDSRYFWLQSW